MRERDIMSAIQLAASRYGCRLFRNNTGALKDHRGKHVKFGLCVGSSDLIGWVGYPILPHNTPAAFLAVEVKRPGWKLTTKQFNFIQAVSQAGGCGIVATSVDEFEDYLLKYAKGVRGL